MRYRIELSRQAGRYLLRLNRSGQERIALRLDQIAESPYGLETKALQGHPDLRAARVGGWRIVFRVNQEAGRVDVSDIGPRGQVYRRQ